MNGAELYTRSACDAIVAIGGGSPIDCAKGIGIVISNKKHILEFEGVDTVRSQPLAVDLHPDDRGERVPMFLTVCHHHRYSTKGEDRDHQQKDRPGYCARGSCPPDLSLTPALICTRPGMDAITHSIEAYVSKATPR